MLQELMASSSNCTTAIHQCVSPMKPTSNGVFQGDNPLDFSLPLMILQICLVVSLTRLLGLMLKPLRQPRVIAEIIGGILLGPSVLGRNKAYLHIIFPPGSLPVLDTLANIGLIFFLFLVGIELDPKALAKSGKRIFAIALAGISLPFALGIGSSFIFRNTISKDVNAPAFIVFMGVAFSITAFPVLARILAELKLLTTDVGRMAMSAAAVNDVAAWILLALAVALSGVGHSPLVCLWVLLSGCGFVLIATLVFRPIFSWIAGRLKEGEPVSESYICATLTAVLAAGFITDAIGIHALFGAFVLGILVPKEGPFANALVQKVEDLVTGLFLPLYFASSGLKTNVATIQGLQSWGLLALVIVTACLGKIIGTVFVSRACKVPWRESLVLGFLMNSKGLVELIVLNIGKDRKVLNDQTFAIMVLMALFTTFITTPLVLMIYSPSKRLKEKEYKHRTIEREDTTSSLRILACFHGMRNIPTLVNLIEATRGTERKESLRLYALHLTELSERSSSILMVNKSRKLHCWNKGRQDTDQIMITFKDFQQLSHVSIKPMASISSMSDMHEDICASAEKKRVAMVILPFHKHQRLDGILETTRAELQRVNEKVLENAKCSVGILVDRGLGGNIHISGADVSSLVTVIFFGGPDDREALSYAVRMAEHPGIALTVIRVSMENEALRENSVIDVTNEESRTTSLSLDDEVITRLRQKIEEKLIQYTERRVRNAAEIVSIVRNYRNCNLFIVGRMQKNVVGSCLTGESAYQELGPIGSYCQELGPVGSYLASNDFSTRASILIVQQYYSETTSTISLEVTSNIPQPQLDVNCETERETEMIRVR